MAEALPLADQPHLLQPNARKEDLFGIPKQPITLPSSSTNRFSLAAHQTGLITALLTPDNESSNPLENLPTRLGLTSRTSEFAMGQPATANQPIPASFNVMGPNALTYPQSYSVGDKSGDVMDSGGGTPGPSTGGSNVVVPVLPAGKSSARNYQSFESLLAVVNSETASGMSLILRRV